MAFGYLIFLLMSLTVMSPVMRPSASTTGSFSMRCRPRISWACSSVVPSGAVTSPSAVMTSETLRVGSFSKRRSRLVRMPTSRRDASTIGTPEMRYLDMRSSAAPTRSSGPRVTGSTIIPDSERLTLSTSVTWSSIERFRWMTPMPPSRAMAIARRASVTVSIAADISGMASSIDEVRRVAVDTWAGTTSDAEGTRQTSSKVSPSEPNRASGSVAPGCVRPAGSLGRVAIT